MERQHRLLALLLIGLFLLQGFLALDDIAPTWDEVGHLPAGYSYLKTGDYRLYATNPPLVKQLAALPLLFLDLKLPLDSPHWENEDHIEFGQAFLYYTNGHVGVQNIFTLARSVILLLGALLGWLIFIWTRDLFGPTAALVALAVYVFNPNVLAHTTLVTTDIGFVLFFVLSIYAMYRYLQAPGWGRLMLLGLAVGLALCTKFTAILLAPILALLLVLHLFWTRQSPAVLWPGRDAKSNVSKWRVITAPLAVALVVSVVALVVIMADYGFQAEPLVKDPEDQAKWEALLNRFGISEQSPLHAPAQFLGTQIPIPARTYFTALAAFAGMSPRTKGENGSFLRGKYLMERRHPKGFWYFTYVAFLIKTPIPLILALFLALATLPPSSRQYLAFFVAPALVLVGMTLKFHDFAYRYVNLPLLPLGAILVGRLATLPYFRRRGMAAAAAVAMVWYLGSALWIHPHYLAYFNEFIGGPSQGYRYMLSSNLDWGQELLHLKKYMEQHRIDAIKLSYNGTAVPEYHGIRHEKLPGIDAATFSDYRRMHPFVDTRPTDGWIAISATCLQNIEGVYPGASYRWLQQFKPEAVLGYSLFVYHISAEELQQRGLDGARP
ncbi:MAG: glycosyltransferase family 39 protein [candidate division KSB1 bacterium]|nr:glycosyltransferase family 39 protein [candidate division KSB1 bacterium]